MFKQVLKKKKFNCFTKSFLANGLKHSLVRARDSLYANIEVAACASVLELTVMAPVRAMIAGKSCLHPHALSPLSQPKFPAKFQRFPGHGAGMYHAETLPERPWNASIHFLFLSCSFPSEDTGYGSTQPREFMNVLYSNVVNSIDCIVTVNGLRFLRRSLVLWAISMYTRKSCND